MHWVNFSKKTSLKPHLAMSRRILAVVEGQTEFSLLSAIVSTHLGYRNISFNPKVVGRPGHKGGVYRAFETVVKEITSLFRQEPTAVVTTFFDFYALPQDWPGVKSALIAKACGKATSCIAKIVEEEWMQSVKQNTQDFDREVKFIPYIQMYELESLLFTSPKDMAETFLNKNLEETFRNIVKECGGCEEINNRPQFAPSKRIEAVYPGYKKGRDRNKTESRRPHAPIIAERIGLDAIRAACPHFNEWVTKLEIVFDQ